MQGPDLGHACVELSARAQPMLDYFIVFVEAFNRFRGFEFKVQGVYADAVDGQCRILCTTED